MRHFRRKTSATDVIDGIEHLRRHIPKPFPRIWNPSRTQRAWVPEACLEVHPEIGLEGVATYAAVLNREDHSQGEVNQRLRNVALWNRVEMREQIQKRLRVSSDADGISSPAYSSIPVMPQSNLGDT